MDRRALRRSCLVHGASVAAIVGCNALNGAGDLRTEPADSGLAQGDGSLRADGAASDGPAVPCETSGTLQMDTRRPTVTVDDPRIGTVPWLVRSNDGQARATLDGNQITHWLVTTDYGFSVPSDASVQGLVVTVTRNAGSPGEIADQGVAIVKAGDPGAPKQEAQGWSTSTRPVTYGASGDTWGSTWTPEAVNASGFGAAVAARGTDALSETASINRVEIAVYFARCKR